MENIPANSEKQKTLQIRKAENKVKHRHEKKRNNKCRQTQPIAFYMLINKQIYHKICTSLILFIILKRLFKNLC